MEDSFLVLLPIGNFGASCVLLSGPKEKLCPCQPTQNEIINHGLSLPCNKKWIVAKNPHFGSTHIVFQKNSKKKYQVIVY